MSEWRTTPYGKAAPDWCQTVLKELCVNENGILSGPFGSQLHQKDYVAVGTPIVTVEHLGENTIIRNDIPCVSEEDKDRLSKYLLRKGDIVFSRVGAVDRRALIRENEEGWLFSGRCLRVRPDTTKIDPVYLSYFFGLPAFREYIRAIAVGATMPSLNTQILSEVIVIHPKSLNEQRAIARILGALDDKIELNRRMNATLEQIARALFKAWFVDFEPVRAKQDGRWRRGESLPGMPAHLYDLFPDRLVDSELEAIPEGWEVSTLGCILTELVSGGRPRGGAVDSGIPSVGAENVIGLGKYDYSKEKFIPEEFFESLKVRGADVRDGDVLLYKDGAQIGRKTYFDKGFPHTVCAVNEHVFILRTGRAWMQRYLYFWLDQDWMTNEIIALNSNSAQPGINQAGVRSLPILLPPEDVLRAFDDSIAPLTGKLFWNCHQSRTLAALRDTLLPQLITGALRVEDVEKVLEVRPDADTAQG